jgi:hypothetical protein
VVYVGDALQVNVGVAVGVPVDVPIGVAVGVWVNPKKVMARETVATIRGS